MPALIGTLFYANAAIWLVFGVVSVMRMVNRGTAGTATLWIVAVLMFANAGAMIVAGWGIGRKRRLFFYLGLAVLLVNILLTFPDEFGAFDLITLLIDTVILVLLVRNRAMFDSAE